MDEKQGKVSLGFDTGNEAVEIFQHHDAPVLFRGKLIEEMQSNVADPTHAVSVGKLPMSAWGIVASNYRRENDSGEGYQTQREMPFMCCWYG